ncbi:hypothetical protein F383_28454 [Gossypium arboreum]|uniref:Uncharacterized protein n=1 Tax=Gossypium arboreum TaxID=29729 RepID=A0A0B0MS54_GOSAR|nr:hypothetical protein F383_28454 [Gossypium arboreum]
MGERKTKRAKKLPSINTRMPRNRSEAPPTLPTGETKCSGQETWKGTSLEENRGSKTRQRKTHRTEV